MYFFYFYMGVQKTETDQTHQHFYGAITENIQNSLYKSDPDKNHVIPTQTQQIVCLEKVGIIY